MQNVRFEIQTIERMKMTHFDMIKEILYLQQKLNDATNGEGWERGYNKFGRIINWRRCIYMECAELIDSFNWKHWKDINSKEPDWDNVKIEIVDIWHFIASLGLEYYKNHHLGSIDDLALFIVESKYFPLFCQEPYSIENKNHLAQMEIINYTEQLMIDALNRDGKSFYKLLDDAIILSLHCGVNVEILYKFYVAKNVLNQFRQDHGYKEGTYQKVINGVEDNTLMLNIIDTKGAMTPDELYKELENAYKKR